MRIVRPVVKILLGVIIGYYVLVNGILLSPLGEKLMNIDTTQVEMHYRRAYSLYPLHVQLYGWTMRAQDPNIQMYITADEASAFVLPWSAVSDKRVNLHHVVGTGLTFWMRLRKMAKDVAPDETESMPPIPGFASDLRDGPPGPPPTDENYDLVTVDMTDMHVTHLKQIWIEQYRYDGDASVDGGFYFRPNRYLRVDPTHIVLAPGELHYGVTPLADHLSGDISVDLLKSNLGDISRQFAAGLTLSTQLQGHINSVDFLNYYFREIPQIRFDEGTGDLKLRLEIARGLIQPDSKLSLDAKHLVVHVPYFAASGGGHVRWSVKQGKAWLDVGLRKVAVRRDSTKKVVMKSEQLNLQAQSSGLDLAQDVHLDVVLDLEEAKAEDLAFLNDFIPERSGFRVTRGDGTVQGNVELSTKTQRGRGALSIVSRKLELQARSATMKGELTVKGKLVDFDMKKNKLDMSGSRIELNHLSAVADAKHYDDFWANIQCDDCLLSPEHDPKWHSRLTVAMKNMQPLLGIVGAVVPVPWALKKLNLSDVKGSTLFVAHESKLTFDDIMATAGPLKVEGFMEMRIKGKSQEPFGALRLSLGELSAGLDLQGGKSNVLLFGSDKWFGEQKGKRAKTP